MWTTGCSLLTPKLEYNEYRENSVTDSDFRNNPMEQQYTLCLWFQKPYITIILYCGRDDYIEVVPTNMG